MQVKAVRPAANTRRNVPPFLAMATQRSHNELRPSARSVSLREKFAAVYPKQQTRTRTPFTSARSPGSQAVVARSKSRYSAKHVLTHL